MATGSNALATETAKLLIICHCGQKMKVPASAIGKSASCVKCGDRVAITAGAAPSADPIPRNFESDDVQNSGLPPLDDATDLLLNAGMVQQSMLDDALIVQRDLPGTAWSILMDMGCLDSKSFHGLMAREERIASIELENYSIPDDVMAILPENLVRQYFVIPVAKLGKLLTLAMVCPHNHSVIKEAENITGLRVKSMLCTYEAMRETIKNKLPFSDVEGTDSITLALVKEFENPLSERIIVRRIFRQHSIVPSASELLRLEEIPNDDLIQLIEFATDSAVLTGRVLQLANSIAYGSEHRVTSVAQAAALMGPEAMRNALQSEESINYKKQHKTFDIGMHLKRSRFCAVAAKTLASTLGTTGVEIAHTLGLMFEIGRLLLLEALPNGYALATRDAIGPTLNERERALYQMPNTEAAYYILRKWNLPSEILEPIRFQAEPKGAVAHRELTHILFLAMVMTRAYVNNEPLHIRTDEEDSMHFLEMRKDAFKSAYETACSAFQRKLQAD